MTKGLFSKTIILAVVAMNIAFTVAVLIVFAKVGSEPVALTGSWFAFTTGELWLMASIKKMKVKKGEPKQDEPDQLETETVEPQVLGAAGGPGDGDPDRGCN